MIKQVLLSATIFASLIASVEAQPGRHRQPGRELNPDIRQTCQGPDLTVIDLMAVTSQTVDAGAGEITFGFLATTDNIGSCASTPSRTKAILTLVGGRWLGQDAFDIPALGAGGNNNVEFEITFAYDGLLDEDCTFTRDDLVLTVSADWRESNAETDESNNAHAFNFQSSTDSLCTSSQDYHLDVHAPFRNPFERPRLLNQRYRQ